MENFSDLCDLETRFTELKEKLQDSLQRLEEIVAHMSDGLIFLTTEGTIALFNHTAEMITSYTSADVLAQSFWNFFDDSVFGFSIKQALQKQNRHQRAVVTLNNSKEIEVSASPIPNKGFLLLIRDRTEIRKMENTIHHNDRLRELGEMGASLAHEIRNPLGGITGFASLLKREITDPNQLHMVDAILKGTVLLNSLVSRILEYAKPLTLHFAPTDFVEMISEIVASIQADPLTTRCSFLAEKKAMLISADREALKSALLNLLRNAFEADATEVKLILSSDGVLSCCDNGCGIAQKDLSEIFTPFFTTKSKGTGLGLSHAHKVITQHGGNLSVESESGKGTTFRISL